MKGTQSPLENGEDPRDGNQRMVYWKFEVNIGVDEDRVVSDYREDSQAY